jgi:hypothetical protein
MFTIHYKIKRIYEYSGIPFCLYTHTHTHTDIHMNHKGKQIITIIMCGLRKRRFGFASDLHLYSLKVFNQHALTINEQV